MNGEYLMDRYTETLNDENNIDGYCNRPQKTDCPNPYKDCTECKYFIRTK